ncbi:histone family protein DNA-binding protein [Paludibacter propionicigenes WB4]|uniref:Histone family protein DNA-binding protein n=1 Tax=Paludibacter propionicigenes (strain DSM 17365 / JCM 13257 / WB4) TaxID=694427 RepID=E4T3M2_PALPW|nr:HU family DNA-binding protein [Paludibacter propionicigenes]ADQ79316.1 histone family protein DNA-binding protein [Paludibacter propionicigenes WB4]
MIKDKISSQEVIDLVSSKAQVSKRVSEDFLKVMISTIEESLLSGDVVKIKNFGTFKLQWNEPRKSVNVHSGEDILLAGYYKVTFTPDVVLKDLVNEPFAHLTPVELDSENPEPQQEKTDVALDPLRIFNDQASEIKDLLSEIQSLSPKQDVAVESPKPVTDSVESIHDGAEYADYLLQGSPVDDSVEEVNQKETLPVEEDVPEPVYEREVVENLAQDKDDEVIVHEQLNEPSRVVENSDYRNEEVVSISSSHIVEDVRQFDLEDSANKDYLAGLSQPEEENSEVQFDSSEFLKEIHPGKLRRFWVRALIVFVLILVTFSGFYLFYAPVRNFTNSTAADAKSSILKTSEKVSMTEMFNTVSNWFTPKQKPAPIPVRKVVIAPKDTTTHDSVVAKVPVDSLQLMFDRTRVYKAFIATETVKPNGRLTIMAKRYYGSKDFWVYIYEANKDRIPDPDRISEGTQIRIPKLDHRLIDPANPRCIKKAKELHDLYVKKED